MALTCVTAVAVASFAAGPAHSQTAGTGQGLEPVALVPYVNGSHLVFTTIGGRDYAFAAEQSSSTGKLRAIDVTDPRHPRVVDEIACGSGQGNVQLSPDRKTLVLGLDGGATGGICPPLGQAGFATIDVSDPRNMRPVGFAVNPRGSHSLAVHPKKPLVFNGSGFPEPRGEMEVWSIANPARPELIDTVETGLHSPHDLAFDRTGTRLATANVVTFQVWDTSNPTKPEMLTESQCPGCQHTHEARFTPDGKRLLVNDEAVTGGGVHPCPGGALYFYDVAEDGASVTLTGFYSPADVLVNAAAAAGFCTPHVFDISRDGKRVAASWHTGGVRYLDITKTSGATFGETSTSPEGAREIGWYLGPGADHFTAKFYKGPYIYTVDLNRGLEVLRITER